MHTTVRLINWKKEINLASRKLEAKSLKNFLFRDTYFRTGGI